MDITQLHYTFYYMDIWVVSNECAALMLMFAGEHICANACISFEETHVGV